MMKPIYCLLALYCSTSLPLLCLAFTTPYTTISNTRTSRVHNMIHEDFNNDKNGNEDDLLLLNRLNELKQQNLNVLSQVSSTSKDASEVFQEERAHILNQILELEKSITLSNRNTDNENDVNVAHVESVANNYFVEQQQEAVVDNESKEEKKKENDDQNTSTILNENQKSSFPSNNIEKNNIQSLKETLASLEKLLDQTVSLMEKEEEMKGTKTTSDDNDISTSSSSVVSKGIGPGSSDYTITTLKIPIQKTIPGLKDFSKRILETSNTLSSVKEYLDFFYNTNNDKGTEEKEVDTSSDTMNPARIEKILLLEHKEIIKLQEEIKNAINDTTTMNSKYGEEIQQQQQQQKKKMKHVPYASRPFTVMKTIGIK